MPLTIRPPTIDELPALSDLCLRSKAVWGYDAAFLDACRNDLSFASSDLETTHVAVADDGGQIIGVAQIKIVDDQADLLKLFVEPRGLRRGTGKILLIWAIDVAKTQGAVRMTIEADPGASTFYRKLGADDIGEAPSGSLPGRMLPKLAIDLRATD